MTTIRFDRQHLQAGDVLAVRGNRLVPSRLIRQALSIRLDVDDVSPLSGPGQPVRVWSNHTALVVPMGSGMLGIGETAPPRSEVVSLDDYEADLNAARARDRREVRVLRPAQWSALAGMAAARLWVSEVSGRRYDHPAYLRLLIRCLIGQHFNLPAGFTRMWFCSEGVGRVITLAAAASGLPNPINNLAPTPYTFEKRVRGGQFRDVSRLCLRSVEETRP